VGLVRIDILKECIVSTLFLRSGLQMLLTPNVVPSSLILSTLKMEVICTFLLGKYFCRTMCG
jgi:hypothetical protein